MKKMLYSSLLLSILMSILFWHREPGISVVLFVIPTLLVIYFNLKQSQKIKNKKIARKKLKIRNKIAYKF